MPKSKEEFDSSSQAQELEKTNDWIVNSPQLQAILPKIKSALDKKSFSDVCLQLIKSDDKKEIKKI